MPFLYTNYEVTEKEIRKTKPFLVGPKIIKFLTIDLTKGKTKCSTTKNAVL